MPQYKLIPATPTTPVITLDLENQMRSKTANNLRTTDPKANRKGRDPRAAKMRAVANKARLHDFRKGGFRR